jgi:Tfp pilus assembly protein PilO
MSVKAGMNKPGHSVLGAGYTLLIAGFVMACVVPFIRGTRAAQADVQRLQEEINGRVARQRQLGEIRKSVAEIKLETAKLDRLLPPNQDLGSFLKELTVQFGEAGMKDISYHNLAPAPLARSMKLPIEVRGRGTYAQFHDFLVRLENLQRLCSVGRMVIDADADMAGGIEVQMTLYIYHSKPTPP